MSVATVLYEDRNAVGETQFVPHRFVLRCVVDRLERSGLSPFGASTWLNEIWDLCPGIACKGNANVLRKCRDDRDVLTARGEALVVVLDGDKVDVPLGSEPCNTERRRRLAAWASLPASTCWRLVVLDRNLERIIETARDSRNTAASDDLRFELGSEARLERAIGHRAGAPADRDAVFGILTFRANPLQRLAFLRLPENASLARLVCTLEALIVRYLDVAVPIAEPNASQAATGESA